MRAAVVALGDLGRSARMQYHARALAASGVDVDLVGLEGTPLPREITDDPRIKVHRIAAPTLRRRTGASALAFPMSSLRDAYRLSFRLWRTLRSLPPPELVLI